MATAQMVPEAARLRYNLDLAPVPSALHFIMAHVPILHVDINGQVLCLDYGAEKRDGRKSRNSEPAGFESRRKPAARAGRPDFIRNLRA